MPVPDSPTGGSDSSFVDSDAPAQAEFIEKKPKKKEDKKKRKDSLDSSSSFEQTAQKKKETIQDSEFSKSDVSPAKLKGSSKNLV